MLRNVAVLHVFRLRPTGRWMIALCAGLFLAFRAAYASELTAVISLKAEHAEYEHWEQWNPGLSFEHRQPTNGPLDVSWSAGSVRDSIGNWSPHAAFGLHHRLGQWSVGVRATFLYRQRDIDGNKVGLKFAPLPSFEYYGEVIGLGVVLIPQPTSSEQDSAALLMQLRMPL